MYASSFTYIYIPVDGVTHVFIKYERERKKMTDDYFFFFSGQEMDGEAKLL